MVPALNGRLVFAVCALLLLPALMSAQRSPFDSVALSAAGSPRVRVDSAHASGRQTVQGLAQQSCPMKKVRAIAIHAAGGVLLGALVWAVTGGVLSDSEEGAARSRYPFIAAGALIGVIQGIRYVSREPCNRM